MAFPRHKTRESNDMPKLNMFVLYDEPAADSRREQRQRCLLDLICSLWLDSKTLPEVAFEGVRTQTQNGALSDRLIPLDQAAFL